MGRCEKRRDYPRVQCADNFVKLVGRVAHYFLDPATGEELGTIPEMGIEETKEAIDAAAGSFATWSKTTAKVMVRHFAMYRLLTWVGQQRHDVLMKFYNLMREHEDDLARIIVSPCLFVLKACSHAPGIDPRKWQDSCRSEGGYYAQVSHCVRWPSL